MSNSVIWARNILVGICLLFIVACGGLECNDSTNEAYFILKGVESVFVGAGTSKTIKGTLENLSDSTSWSLKVRPVGTVPTGLTVTYPTTQLLLGRPIGTKMEVDVTIAVAAGSSAATRTLTLEAYDVNVPERKSTWTIVVNIGAGSVTTGIRESMPMVGGVSHLFEGQAEISNGEGFPICTMLGVTPSGYTLDTDALIWMRPNSGGFCADPGDKEFVTVAGLARSNMTGRTFNQAFHFNWGANLYSYSTSWTVSAASSVGYTITAIDYFIGQRMTDPDKTASYSVTVDPILAGRAGLYTFSLQGLPAKYSASIVPPTVAVNAAGDPVTVQVTITRIADSSREETDEFTLAATHESSPDINLLLKLPIQNFLGRSFGLTQR